MFKGMIIVGACGLAALAGMTSVFGGVADAATTAPSVASGSTAAPSPVPRLAEFRVRTYRSGYQEFAISFEGPLRSCDVVQSPARIKIIFKGKGVNWNVTNTWCMDGCGCALGEGTWGAGAGFLFENENDAIAAKKLVLTPTDAFGGLEIHKTFPLGYWVIIDGKLARSGRLDLRIDKGYRTIRQGEDDFVNVCINDLKRLYSSGGRLYCLDLEFSYRMKLLR